MDLYPPILVLPNGLLHNIAEWLAIFNIRANAKGLPNLSSVCIELRPLAQEHLYRAPVVANTFRDYQGTDTLPPHRTLHSIAGYVALDVKASLVQDQTRARYQDEK